MITGAAGGIGEAAARACVAAGASVVLIDSDGERLDRVARSMGERVLLARAADVREHEPLSAVAAALVERAVRVDVLVNNAATYAQGPLIDVPPDELDRCVRVNALGLIACCRAFVPLMADANDRASGQRERPRRRPPQIINVLSEFAWLPFPNKGSYCISKSAAAMASACLRVELRARGIRVTDFIPPAVDTGLVRNARAVSPELLQREADVVRAHAWPVDAVGRRLVAAVERPRDRVTCGLMTRAAILGARWCPGITSRLAARTAARMGLCE